jgi:hypothetical protein
MGWRIGGAGRFGPRRAEGVAMGAKSVEPAKPAGEAAVEGSLEVTLEELQEFLDADRLDVRARPEFKESLRERLWAIVLERSRRRRERSGD